MTDKLKLRERVEAVELVEVMARAMWAARESTMAERTRMNFDEGSPSAKNVMFYMTKAALEAIRSAGYAVVPREPCGNMVIAGRDYIYGDYPLRTSIARLGGVA